MHIPSTIADDSVQGLLFDGFYLYVREADVDRAKEILEGLGDVHDGEAGLTNVVWTDSGATGLIGFFARLPRWVVFVVFAWALLFGLGAITSAF